MKGAVLLYIFITLTYFCVYAWVWGFAIEQDTWGPEGTLSDQFSPSSIHVALRDQTQAVCAGTGRR